MRNGAIRRIDMRFPGGRSKAFTLSYDDGVEQDLRLIELLKQYELKATFNLNSGLFAPEGTRYPAGTIHRRMTREACLEAYRDPHCEVAVHGLTHPFLETLPLPAALEEIISDRKNLEEAYGVIVRGMAYPFGTYSEQVIEALKTAGIAYARTVASTREFELPKRWHEWHPTCHHTDPELETLTKRFAEAKPERASLLFYVWGHTYEFEKDGNWPVMEKLCEEISGKEDVWYASNLEIYDYVTAFRQLQWSVDGEFVKNPTAADLWFSVNGILQHLPGGASAVL